MPDLTVNGVRLAVEDVGEGPPILFVHGFPLDRSLWQHQIAGMNGYRRVAPDLRGMGRSAAPASGYSMASYAADLRSLLDRLVLDRVILCGLSMGGYIAFECLRIWPERVAALVLMDTRAEPDDEEAQGKRDAMISEVRAAGASAVVAGMLPRLLGSTTAQKSPEVVAQVRRMILETPTPGLIGALQAMKVRADSRPLLPSLNWLPTLILVGAEDVMTPPDAAEAMTEAIPNAALEVIPEAGHLPPLERPEIVTARLHQFLDARM
jgi:3-oxoadipate enol-lactonase